MCRSNLALYISTNGFASSSQIGTDLALGPTNWTQFDYNDASSTLYSGTVSFRLYGWNATSTSGTNGLELDEIWISGNVAPVPEPTTVLSVLAGIGVLMGLRRKRRVA